MKTVQKTGFIFQKKQVKTVFSDRCLSFWMDDNTFLYEVSLPRILEPPS